MHNPEYTNLTREAYEYRAESRKILEALDSGCLDIPEKYQHPCWGVLSKSITPVLPIWQVAMIYNPLGDVFNTDHPEAQTNKNARRFFLFDLLDCIISNRSIELLALPSEIPHPAQFDSAPEVQQVQAKISVDDLAKAINDFHFYHGYSPVVRRWRMLIAQRSKPAPRIAEPLESPRVIKKFTRPISWLLSDKNGVLVDSIENLPSGVVGAGKSGKLSIKTMDSYDTWLSRRMQPSGYDEQWLQYHWMQERWQKVQADIAKTISCFPPPEKALLPQLETPNPHAKPPEQRQAILREIDNKGWDSLQIPRGGKEELKKWYVENFRKSGEAFNKRWKELRKENLLESEGNTLK